MSREPQSPGAPKDALLPASVGPEHEQVLASLFDTEVASACLDAAPAPDTLPADEPWLAQASRERQLEFLHGRSCARRALEKLGVASVPIGRGVAGEPIWPAGVVGSITHTEGLCAVIAASSVHLRGVGVDVELDRPESMAFARRICSDVELQALAGIGEPIEALALVVFSAKEASYKLQFPLTQDLSAWSDIDIRLARETFRVTFGGSAGQVLRGPLYGRWRRALGFIWAGVMLRQP